jgi:hypothetical protein
VPQIVDITAERLNELIGFTATSTLCAWFGGQRLFIPEEAIPTAPLAALIGEPALRRLSAMFGGELIAVPVVPILPTIRRVRQSAPPT